VPFGVPFFPLPVVAVVTVAVLVMVPLSETEVGEMVQLPAGGAPEQLSATVPVKPLIGVTLIVYVVDLPAVRVCVEGDADTEKSVPVPKRGRDCGLLVALSEMVIAPVLDPVAVGVKVTWIVQ
jgi:hypothetical protein